MVDRRSVAFIAVFGGLWGLSESTLGSFLHLVRLPLSGLILSAIALVIILIARTYNNTRGSTFLMGLVAALIKLVGLSITKIGPMVGIIMEGALAELVFLLLGPRKTGFVLTGLVIALYPIAQSLLTKTILFGADFVPLLLETAQGISNRFGYQAGWWLVGLYFLIHIVIGLAAVLLTLVLLKRLKSHPAHGIDSIPD
jgi:hypothetical protein